MENLLRSNIIFEMLTLPTSTETSSFLKNNSLLGMLAKSEKCVRFKTNGSNILDGLTVIVLKCPGFGINSIPQLILEGKVDFPQKVPKHPNNLLVRVFGKKALLKGEVCDHCMHILLDVITVSVLQVTKEK